ncbi:MAG: tRNA (guanosine(37)-N1)-methyltransferase TrmD [Patescibacteria group bacterium]
MKFDIITIFPELFNDFTNQSLIARAIKKKLISVKAYQLRKWTTDNHKTVDDRPYGGGPGLVMKVEPIFKAVMALKKRQEISDKRQGKKSKSKVILLSPRGEKFDQAMAKKFSKLDQLIFICGRYEGVDERVADNIADEVVSVGDFVLNGGEVGAMVIMEAVSRLIPGFMHDADSASKDDHAQYTKPEVFEPKKGKKWQVPKVLLSGDHTKIKAWRDTHR